MKYTIALIALLSYAAFAQDSSPQLSVEEIFSVETSEELEAALTDGYPMPWLAEILEDETIPEEDRYWLDSRVRAVIARDLHLFFSRDGEPLHVEAEGGIRNGESYWREIFIVEPVYIDKRPPNSTDMPFPGQPDLRPKYEPPYYFNRSPGYIVNNFGEKIGEIATTDIGIHLSRDGRRGILPHGYFRYQINPSSVYFLNSDTEINKVAIGPRLSTSKSISFAEDGSIVLVSCFGDGEDWIENLDQGLGLDYPLGEVMLHIFSGAGDLINNWTMPNRSSGSSPKLSPDGRYIGYSTGRNPESVFLLNTATGETIFEWNQYGGKNLYFTRNSKYLCAPGARESRIYDCETGEIVFQVSERYEGNPDYLNLISASNNLSVITGARVLHINIGEEPEHRWEIFLNSELYSSEPISGFRVPEVSPNGYFIDIQDYSPLHSRFRENATVPYTVMAVKGER